MDRETSMPEQTTTRIQDLDRRGFAMVTTLLVVLVLSVIALGAAWMASSEKKTTFAEGAHMRATLSADAGSEAGINFIRVSDTPPRINDFGTMSVTAQGETVLKGSQSYAYNCRYLTKRPKAGWGMKYLDYDYSIGSQGQASTQSQSNVSVLVSRLFKEGY